MFLCARFISRRRLPGFSLVEVLVVVAVLAVLIGVTLPVVSSIRVQARRAACLTLVRDLNVGVMTYASDARGVPPALFRAQRGTYLMDPPQVANVGGESIRGYWFDSSFLYDRLLQASTPGLEVFGPATPQHVRGTPQDRGPMQFFLTETLYAAPSLWNDAVTSEQDLRIQMLDNIRFPSQKGLIQQWVAYFEPRGLVANDTPMLLPGSTTIPGAVAWADNSCSTVVQGRLRPGIPNAFDHGILANGGQSLGLPILRTRNGIEGLDWDR